MSDSSARSLLQRFRTASPLASVVWIKGPRGSACLGFCAGFLFLPQMKCDEGKNVWQGLTTEGQRGHEIRESDRWDRWDGFVGANGNEAGAFSQIIGSARRAALP